MAIGGGIKFFKKQKASAGSSNVTITSSSGDASSLRAIDKNRLTYWRSVNSDDTITETITIVWTTAQALDRLLLVDHNWKEYTVKYWNGASYVDFSSVVGLDGSLGSISETTFAEQTSYYEFAGVSTTQVQITVSKTQVADAEKYINQIILTEEIGTLSGYPDISGKFTRNARERKMLSGKILSLKSEESYNLRLKFQNYPSSLGADINIMDSLYDSEDPFCVWLCGGRRGTSYFRHALKGFRLKDIFQMQVTKAINPDYTSNVYINPLNCTYDLDEAVD